MKILLLLTIFLTACSHKLILIYESGEAINQDVKIDATDSINATKKENITTEIEQPKTLNYWESK